MWIAIFGYGLAALALATSAGMIVLGRRWQVIEASAYGGARRPIWFWAAAAGLLIIWALAAADFAASDRNWAGWALIAGVPLGWALKGAAVVFNPEGRKAVSGIDTDKGWRRIGLARLPIVFVLIALAAFA
ncbi:hypothetical protein [Jannaschia seohaensis]|uniref:Uncharacterized protein n=1 Tax=Jannaschia seohaensis TaxID=475081 RepID=A0A2Y9B4U6_9RHOB|nr:hypothetical protein [Jannaschia seohaensis]PWJ10682.1 hypothetical protein BCF38_1226 [Jannaschia seohaensis]SSA51546.1 hypothetical protein SAMN05421539_1226 [Jannaschia seohaensis]